MPGLQKGIAAEKVGAVAAAINDFQLRPVGQQLARELMTGDVVRHHEIGQEEMDVGTLALPDLQGFQAVAGLDDAVAVHLQKGLREAANGFLVFHEKDGLRSAGGLVRRRGRELSGGLRIVEGQIRFQRSFRARPRSPLSPSRRVA